MGGSKHHLTTTYAGFLARWAKHLSWQEVAEAFQPSWDHVFRSVEMAVAWGRAHQNLSGIHSSGVDEIQWQRGHQSLTLVYQIDVSCKRLLWVGEKRTVRTLWGGGSGGWGWSEARRCSLSAVTCGGHT